MGYSVERKRIALSTIAMSGKGKAKAADGGPGQAGSCSLIVAGNGAGDQLLNSPRQLEAVL